MYENNKQTLENDILVLYVLCDFPIAISEKAITELMLTPGLVNYFSFRESLSRLIERGYIEVTVDNDGLDLFAPTEDGRIALKTMEDSISPAVKTAYDQLLLKEKDKICSESLVNAYPFIDINKNQSVRCFIRENNTKVVDLRFPVPDKETADKISENWKKNAYLMLAQLTELLEEGGND